MRKRSRRKKQKSEILAAKPKKAQEEMVGFALIIIIVAIIMLVFLAISFNARNREPIDSYKVEGFINSLLQYTTECEDKRQGFVSVRDLIWDCHERRDCLDDTPSCEVLKNTLRGAIDASWQVGSTTRLKGYMFNISINGEPTEQAFVKGETTSYNSWGATEELPRNVKIEFIAYFEQEQE